MTRCNGCEGSPVAGCCSPVVLPYSQIEAAKAGDAIEPENLRWVLEDLTPMTRREGLRQAPYMTNGLTILGNEDTGEATWVWSHFYTCRHYDADNKRCMNYENRPPICRDFPWYAGDVDHSKSLPEHCSFRADQDRSQAVTIMDKMSKRRIG